MKYFLDQNSCFFPKFKLLFALHLDCWNAVAFSIVLSYCYVLDLFSRLYTLLFPFSSFALSYFFQRGWELLSSLVILFHGSSLDFCFVYFVLKILRVSVHVLLSFLPSFFEDIIFVAF